MGATFYLTPKFQKMILRCGGMCSRVGMMSHCWIGSSRREASNKNVRHLQNKTQEFGAGGASALRPHITSHLVRWPAGFKRMVQKSEQRPRPSHGTGLIRHQVKTIGGSSFL